MNEMYNFFRLLGYKINEFPNGYFLIKSPEGKCSLFDTKGNIVLNSIYAFHYLSDNLYIGVGNDSVGKIVNAQGDIIDRADMNKIKVKKRFISVTHLEKGTVACNVYDVQGKSKFKIIDGEPINLMINSYGTSLLYRDCGFKAIVQDAQGDTRHLDTHILSIKSYNNHYIKTTPLNGQDSSIIDYQENIICPGGYSYIDNSKSQGKGILRVDDQYISLINIGSNELVYHADDESGVLLATHTSEPYIIGVRTHSSKSYLLNMLTGDRSKLYNSINVNEFIGNNIAVDGKLYSIDRKTFKETLMAKECTKFIDNECMLKISNVDKETYYTKDFRKLVHEF